MNYIEERLCKVTENFAEGRKYYKQWELAKEYIPQVLNTISHYFPHYSLHDKSHSESILNNIVKILDHSTIDKMSVVDLWLLLTSSYYHDIGMYVSAEDKNKILCPDDGFVNYLAKKKKDENSPMHEYACLFDIKDGKIYYQNKQLTPQNIDALRFLIADYFRKKHAERSEKNIDNDLSINLPGNPIPQRIINLLGKICRAHTQNQQEVMKLPMKESSGCGTENCHPRYIACLLRIGDLLDIDTNRVSEVLLSTLPTIPADSIFYNETNRDITHIHIDQSVIEMTASCKEYEVARRVDEWFKMIESEISFQKKNWYLIVPDPSFGALPSTGKMTVELEGYDNFNLEDKPKFKIDDDRAIEMLQGAGLYKKPSQCIRELLQNAVDATYLRIFKEHHSVKTIEEFRDLCAKEEYQIHVDLKKDREDNDFVYWKFTLTDQGLGMSKEELKYLSCTGSSRQNETKQKIIESMPTWMRPSGTFGIGFQSVFLITDIVNMETRRWGREDTLKLKLYNPVGKDKGNILLQSLKDEDHPFGTTISFEIKMKAKHESSYEEGRECPEIFVNHDDFLYGQSSDIRYEIEKFAEFSFIPLSFQYENEIGTLRSEENTFEFYDEETGLQVKIDDSWWGNGLLFRNQRVYDYRLNLPYLYFTINILSGDARDILTLNRNNIRSEYRDKLRSDIFSSTYKYIVQKFNDLPDDDDYFREDPTISTKQIAAAYLEWSIHKGYPKEPTKNLNLDKYWKDIIVCDEYHTNYYSIGDLLNSQHISIDRSRYDLIHFYNKEDQQFFERRFRAVFCDLLLFVVHNYFRGIQFTSEGFRIQKDQVKELIAEDHQTRIVWLSQYKPVNFDIFVNFNSDFDVPHFDPERELYSRENMPCNERYKKLAVKNDWYEPTFQGLNFEYPVMVCPFVRRRGGKIEYLVDDKVIDYVFEHRVDKNVTKEEIREAYDLFYEDFKQAAEEVNKRLSD